MGFWGAMGRWLAGLLVAALFDRPTFAFATSKPVYTLPVFGVRLPKAYGGLQLISVAHEAGSLNDIRAIIGNDIAAKVLGTGTRPFPDGTIIVRLVYQYVASDRNNAIFGQPQSFVAGAPANVQVSVKNSKMYAIKRLGLRPIRKWPYANALLMQGLFACHRRCLQAMIWSSLIIHPEVAQAIEAGLRLK